MTKKLIHVDAYVKDDGTKVKEHYRGGRVSFRGEYPPIEDAPDRPPLTGCAQGELPPLIQDVNFAEKVRAFLTRIGETFDLEKIKNSEKHLVLEGGVSKDTYSPNSSSGGDGINVMEAISVVYTVLNVGATIAVKAIDIALQIKDAIENFDDFSVEVLSPQMNSTIETLKQSQEISFKAEQKISDKLVNTKNQKEYSKIYDEYLKIRDLNRKNQNSLQKIEYAVANQDYNTAQKELENYSQVQNKTKNELKKNKEISNGGLAKILVADMLKNNPKMQQQSIGGFLNAKNFNKNIPDAKGLWDVSVSNFEKDVEYSTKNAYVVNSISELPQNLQQRVYAKVNQQMGVEDAKGIVFYPSTELASQLINSAEYKDFLAKNIEKLLNGETVSGSYWFKSNENLRLALGHADILNAHIDNNGNIISYVLDTYDFNENDLDWKVQVAYNIQKHGLITNYFVLIPVVIPKEVWRMYFI